MSLCGCGSGDDTSVDGGDTDGAIEADGGQGIAAVPDIPWLAAGAPSIAPPSLTPCPDGWRELPPEDDGDPAMCDPYPEGGAVDCPPGQAHFAGEAGCAPVGAPCPAGVFAAGLPVDSRVVYVRPGSTGGDGTEASPYGSVLDFSVAGLPTSSVIALSTGLHEGPMLLSRGLTLRGACAEATVVRSLDPDATNGVVTLSGTGGAVRDLTLADSPRRGVRLTGSGAEGRLEGVIFTGMGIVGVIATDGSRLSAQRIVVRDTAERSSDGTFGRGLIVQRGATAEVGRAVLSRNRDSGAYVAGSGMGTAVTLSDIVVRDTESRASDGRFGRGLLVVSGATVELSRALLSGNDGLGVLALSPDTGLALSDVVVRDTGSGASGEFGRGLSFEEVTAQVSRTLVSRNRDAGVFVGGAGAAATLSDVVVRDTEGRMSDGESGRGLNLAFAATAEVSRARLSRNEDVGVFTSEMDTTLTLLDVVVRETGSRASDGTGGNGLSVQLGATAVVNRALMSRNRWLGVFAHGTSTALSASDLVVQGTEAQASDGRFGRGLNVQIGATAEVTRVLLSGNRDIGVFASDATALTMTDAVVRDTESLQSDGFLGRGLDLTRGATVEMSRVLVSRNRDLGIYAAGGSGVTVVDVVVSGTRPRGCADTTCVGAEAGHGVGVYDPGTTLRMTRFSVRDSALCGLHLADDGALDLEDGEVRGQPIGVCLQVDGYDTTRLTTSVRYVDNGINLDATTLPVPTPAEVATVLP